MDSDVPSLGGRFDASNAKTVGERLIFHLCRQEDERVHIDCSELTHIDSMGLTVLDHVRNQSGKAIVLCKVRPEVRAEFEAAAAGSNYEFE